MITPLETALFLISIFAIALFGLNLLRALLPSRREAAKRWLKISGTVFAASFVAFGVIASHEQGQQARSLGFDSAQDRRAAIEAGYSDSKNWREYKAKELTRAA